jgi:hypothetical protein
VWHYLILRNEDFINNLVEKERDFLEGFFIPGVMPAAGIDSARLYGGSRRLPSRPREESRYLREKYVKKSENGRFSITEKKEG